MNEDKEIIIYVLCEDSGMTMFSKPEPIGKAVMTKATAEEFGVPYLENKTLMDALKSHISALQKFGRLPDINEVLA